MSILTGSAIREAIEEGTITVDPYDPECVNPASIDLRLGDKYAVYTHRASRYLPMEEPCDTSICTMPREGWILNPGVLYLMHTMETVGTTAFAASLHGKSSIGRLGIQVHSTAGYIDPGFLGQITLEVTCVHPVKVLPGHRFCQLRFDTLEGKVELYNGHYRGAAARGAQASRVWEQVAEEDQRNLRTRRR